MKGDNWYGHLYGHGMYGNRQDGDAVVGDIDTKEEAFIPDAYE